MITDEKESSKILKLYEQPSLAVNNAYEDLASSIYLNKSSIKHNSFAFIGCLPKVGTTSVAINTAISLSHSGHSTLLIDGDLRKRNNKKHLNTNRAFGLTDYLIGTKSFDKIVQNTNISGLSYIASGTYSTNTIRLLNSESFAELIAFLEEKYSYVIIDSSTINSVTDAMLIAKAVANAVIIVNQNSVRKIDYENSITQLNNINANIFGVVYNDINKIEYKRHFKNYNKLHKQSKI